MKNLLLTLVLASSISAFAADGAKKEELKADREAVNNACKTEGTTAGCGDQKVGTGLLKCIHKYKKAHREEFKISEGCKSAMQELHKDKKAK